MKRALLIAEKPSLMRSIQDVYRRNQKQLPYTCDFLAQSGHLVALKLPSELDASQKTWKWENLPFFPDEHGGWRYKVIVERKKGNFQTPQERFSQIKKALHSGNYDFVIHAGDPDREGELLVRLVLVLAENDLPVKRFWSNDLTEKAVLYALQNLQDDDRDPDMNHLFDSALGRQRADYLFGMNISEAASLKSGRTVSMGRVESPILKIVVDRENEIRNFIPRTSYGVKAAYEDGFDGLLYNKKEEKSEEEDSGVVYFPKRKEADDLVRTLSGKSGKIVSYESERTKTLPPKLFKLSTLQIEAGRLGFSADKTLKICQSLYESKYLSYPRTDCEYLSSEEDFSGILHALTGIPSYRNYTESVSSADIASVRRTKKWVNDDALKESGHSALRPTTIVPSSLSGEEQIIYDLVCRRFLAIFQRPLVQDKVRILTDIGGSLFKSDGKTVVDRGFTEVLGTEIADKTLLLHQKGDILPVKRLSCTEKTTVCPSRYTSADLIKVCENPLKFLDDEKLKHLGKNLKIGTPATRAGIIEKLADKYHYLLKEKKGKKEYLYPSDVGEQIVNHFGDLMICRVDMTGVWEEMLEDIRIGKMTVGCFESRMENDVRQMLTEVREKEVSVREEDARYPLVWNGRETSFKKIWAGHIFSDEECRALANGEEITFRAKKKDGAYFTASGKLAEQTYKGKKFLGFSLNQSEDTPGADYVEGTWRGRSVRFKRTWGGHVFTDTEIKDLLSGKEISITGLQSKSGKTYGVKGKLMTYRFQGRKCFGFSKTDFL